MYENDSRVVLTLDAGGTNFAFSALQACQEAVSPIVLSSHADHLEDCLNTIIEGFSRLMEQLNGKGLQAAAISFAFPGPADYRKGIIMDLNNLKAFRGGVALGPMLEDRFHLPVFINNDADLFTYGECLAGVLPEVNRRLEAAGVNRRFQNLIGFTFGTGFGCGITSHQELYFGDNSSAGEIILMRHKTNRDIIIEDGVSIRAIKRVYHEYCQDERELEPIDIFNIAEGKMEGHREAALKSFEVFGEIAGDGIAQAITLLDGLIVIGGGLAGARKYFLPSLLRELNGNIGTLSGQPKDRLEMKVYPLDEEEGFKAFCQKTSKSIQVPHSHRTVEFDPVKKTGLVFSRLGANRATSLGAYTFALHELDKLRS